MGINRKCPRCGSTHVQLSDERSKHGCLWLILFGFFYLAWIIIKWIIGLMVFLLIDWWMAILRDLQERVISGSAGDFSQALSRYTTATTAVSISGLRFYLTWCIYGLINEHVQL